MIVKGLRQEDYCEFELELHSESLFQKKKTLNFFFMTIFLSHFKCVWTFCLYVYLCTTHMSSGCEGQKRALGVLGLEFHTVISYHGVLGLKPGSSGRADSALKYWATVFTSCCHLIYFYSFLWNPTAKSFPSLFFSSSSLKMCIMYTDGQKI